MSSSLSALHLVDLDPVAELALLGALVASLPVLWVAWHLRRRGERGALSWQRALTWTTLFLTIDLVVFGAFTRLTDSGLGCPDWPGCYGSVTPVGAREAIEQAQAVLPEGPVTHGKAWIEMLHRYFAMGVGGLIVLLLVLAWRTRGQPAADGGPRPAVGWAVATLVWVLAQGLFGALTVTMKLFPLIVTLHLLGGLLGVALLTAQATRWQRQSALVGGAVPQGVVAAVLGLWFVQAALGGWVSTNTAVLACAEFPTCQSQWWPSMNWQEGFTLWRGLGLTASGDYIGLPALTAIHMAHRLMAVVVVAAVLALAWRLRATSSRAAMVTLVLLVLQLVSGLSNVLLGWPLLAALGHTLGSALMVAWLTHLLSLPAAAWHSDLSKVSNNPSPSPWSPMPRP